MLYRHHVEFAVGHGIGVHADVSPDPNRAVRVCTTVVPSYEVPRTTPPRPEDAEINPAFAQAGWPGPRHEDAGRDPADSSIAPQLAPLVDGLPAWIDREAQKIDDPCRRAGAVPADRPAGHRPLPGDAQAHRGGSGPARDRPAGGAGVPVHEPGHVAPADPLALLGACPAGREPWTSTTIDIPANRSWYPFQLAFILLNLPGITQLDHPERSESPDAVADLFWFPTGGGKTEAYLGLTAYTLGLRRLQGPVEGRSGENGIAVLMRYTLRLLTHPAVPAGGGPDLCLRGHPPHRPEQQATTAGARRRSASASGSAAARRPTGPAIATRRSKKRMAGAGMRAWSAALARRTN